MTIKVLFFARLKDAFGTGERTVEVPEGLTVGRVVQSLFKSSGLNCPAAMPLLYSVNEHFAGAETVLQNQDVLALLPPVAGG